MKKEVGLWIDHRRAVIVTHPGHGDEIKQITSDMDSGEGESHHDTTEDGGERRLDGEMKRFYDEVITYLRDATSVLIMGPGEAKIELEKRLEGHEPSDRIVTVKTADKMTDHQIAAEVRQHFDDAQPGSKKATEEHKTVKAT